MAGLVRTHRDLEVYRRAFDASMRIFELTRTFPREEIYSLTDHIRRSSRAVCAALAEAWRKRRYEAAFAAKLNEAEAEAEAAETQTWLEYAAHCDYTSQAEARALYRTYDAVLTTLVGMIRHASHWTMPRAAANRGD